MVDRATSRKRAKNNYLRGGCDNASTNSPATHNRRGSAPTTIIVLGPDTAEDATQSLTMTAKKRRKRQRLHNDNDAAAATTPTRK